MPRFVVTLTCADRTGIVHSLASGVLAAGGNMVESAQFSDTAGRFFMRTSFDSDEGMEVIDGCLRQAVERFEPTLTMSDAARPTRAIIMVSQQDHCLREVLYQWDTGAIPIDVVAVVSNHEDCRPLAQSYGLEYVHIPVTEATKRESEAQLMELVTSTSADLLVLARYMQVLSDDVCHAMPNRIINIHHSFLPGFKGAQPYRQAYDRGVKLIGATAHYVTPDLDEGPIIEQDVVRVTHAQSAQALAAIGRDVERRVLSRAVRLHAEHRVLCTGSRTVVFD